MKRIELARRTTTGGTEPTTEGCALLIGITLEQLLKAWDPATGFHTLPPEFQRKAQKRSKTAENAVGENTATVVLAYWAVTAWNARIDFDETAGQLWAVIDEC